MADNFERKVFFLKEILGEDRYNVQLRLTDTWEQKSGLAKTPEVVTVRALRHQLGWVGDTSHLGEKIACVRRVGSPDWAQDRFALNRQVYPKFAGTERLFKVKGPKANDVRQVSVEDVELRLDHYCPLEVLERVHAVEGSEVRLAFHLNEYGALLFEAPRAVEVPRVAPQAVYASSEVWPEEGVTMEYKSSFVFPAGGTGLPSPMEQLRVLMKELVSFMNTEGGDLWLGVTDKGVECGIEKELFYLPNLNVAFATQGSYKANVDSLMRVLQDAARYFISGGPLTNDTLRIESRQTAAGHLLVRVHVERTEEPRFLREIPKQAQLQAEVVFTYYYRTGSECNAMHGQALWMEFVRRTQTKAKPIDAQALIDAALQKFCERRQLQEMTPQEQAQPRVEVAQPRIEMRQAATPETFVAPTAPKAQAIYFYDNKAVCLSVAQMRNSAFAGREPSLVVRKKPLSGIDRLLVLTPNKDNVRCYKFSKLLGMKLGEEKPAPPAEEIGQAFVVDKEDWLLELRLRGEQVACRAIPVVDLGTPKESFNTVLPKTKLCTDRLAGDQFFYAVVPFCDGNYWVRSWQKKELQRVSAEALADPNGSESIMRYFQSSFAATSQPETSEEIEA